MTAEAVAHHDDRARAVVALIARAEGLHHRLGNDRDQRFHAQGVRDQRGADYPRS
jgi:hypothetical protein